MKAALDLAFSQLRSEMEYLTSGEVRIVCCGSGKVWEISGAAGKVGDRICQFDRHDRHNQRWLLVCINVGMRLFEIKSPFCGHVADVFESKRENWVHLQVNSRNGGDNQRFVFEKTQIEGEYFLRAWHSNLVLDVEGISNANNAPIIQWERHGGTNQRFRIERITNPTQTNL